MTEPAASSTRFARPRRLRILTTALALAVVALLVVAAASASAAVTEVNLAQYKRIERDPLPLPPGTLAPAHSLLAEEASGVTYDPVTETLFVVGDGGTSVVQVGKKGELINSMTLAPGLSPDGTTFYDTEGIAYLGTEDGNPELVITEERESKLDRFTYVAGGELTRAAAQTVVIGEKNPNIGIEGVTNDPLHPNQMIAIKESGPERVYSTEINWTAETATNFEAHEGELFPAADVGTLDFSDIYALANVPGISAAEEENLLIISQESGEVVNISRSGTVNSRLAELAEPSDTISVPEMTNEGVTMDQNGMLYIVDEDGGGSQAHPQLWVYEPQTAVDTAPSAVTLGSQVTSLPEATTGARVKLATVTVTDLDEFGENNLTVTGPDASDFEVDHNGLYLKAGTVLKASTQAEYEVSVQVTDPEFGPGPDATSAPYKLTVEPNTGGISSAQVAITEVAPWSSGHSPFMKDWFELTNVGTTKVELTGWRMNDNHASFASSVPLQGVTSLAPGHSAVFVNGDDAGDADVGEASVEEFVADWFPAGKPAGFQIGWMPEVGLNSEADQVNIYDSTGAKVSGVAFGLSPSAAPFGTFDNTAALGVGATTDPTLTTLSTVGTNEAFSADGGSEVGSPGTAPVKSPVAVTEAAPWGSEEVEYEADWFELTNESPVAVSLTGWKMDDSSDAFVTAVALHGVETVAPGESVVFVETPEGETAGEEAEVVTKFETSWFGSSVPAGLQVGTYNGEGVGLSSSKGDGVNIFDSEGDRITGVSFGVASTATPLPSFENAAGLGNYKAPVAITDLSVEGVNGAFVAHDQLGSPGRTAEPTGPPPLADVKVTEVDALGNKAPYDTDWFELTNLGDTEVSLAGWRASDSADTAAPDESGELTGVTSLAAGASAVFLEDPTKTTEFEAAWYPGGVPSGFLIGAAAGMSGLSNTGDQVNVFGASGEKITGVAFGTTTIAATLDNSAGIGNAETQPPTISIPSVAGTNGAFTDAGGETGSPGTIANAVTPPPVLPEIKITEVDPTGSSSGDGYEADWFELTNKGTTAVELTGWKMDDNSDLFADAVALEGIATLQPGETALFLEMPIGKTLAEEEDIVAKFKNAWFGANFPAGIQTGRYHGSGVGLSSGGDQVNVFEGTGEKVTGVAFGATTSAATLDNSAGLGSSEGTPPTISTLSVAGTNGAFTNANHETGSPGAVVNDAALSATSPTFPSQAVGTVGPGQWVTVTNTGIGVAQILGVGIEEENRESAGDFTLAADHCTGAGLNPGQSCEVLVRFSPGRENATSNAQLVIASNAVDSPLTVSLAGTSTGLPEGPKGEKGDGGLQGEPGEKGDTGATGAKGDTGAKGETGPAGPAGPRGATGPAGKNGKDGVVSFTTSEGGADAYRGGVAHLQFVLKNGTVGSLSGAKLRAPSLSGNGTTTARISTLKPGEKRKLSLSLDVGKHAALGRHKLKVELSAGGHTLTQSVTVTVTR